MPKIDCTYASMKASAGRFRDLSGQINSIDAQIDSIIRNIPLSTLGYMRLRSQLRQLALVSVKRTAEKCNTIANGLDTIVSMYTTTDLAVAAETSTENKIIKDMLDKLFGSVPRDLADILKGLSKGLGPAIGVGPMLWALTKIGYTKSDLEHYSDNPLFNGFLNGVLGQGNYEQGGIIAMGENDKLLSNYMKLSSNLTLGKGTIKTQKMESWVDKRHDKAKAAGKRDSDHYNSDDKKGDSENVKDSHKFAEKVVDVAGWETSASASLLHADGKHYGDMGGGEYSVDVGKIEGHAGFGAGVYKYKDKDGKVHYGKGVHAEMGSSVSVLEASASARYGKENLNVHAKGEAKVLAASAEASGQVAWTDKGPQVYAGVNAEAVAAEVGGSVGVNVGGVDVGVKGSVKVGVGASANVGIKDGHLVCDLSASLGVGFSIGIDIDVSGITKTATKAFKACKDTWNGVCSAAKKIGKALWPW